MSRLPTLCVVTDRRRLSSDPARLDSSRLDPDRSDPDRSDPDRSDPDRSNSDRSNSHRSDLDRSDSSRLELLIAQIEEAAAADFDLVQIREPDLAAAVLLDLVTRAVSAVRGTRTRIIVNDRLDVALAAGAHGVHLRSTSVDALRIRAAASGASAASAASAASPSPGASGFQASGPQASALQASALQASAKTISPSRTAADAASTVSDFSSHFLIGRSVHSAEEAAAVEAAGGLDYLILGTIFPTTSKPAIAQTLAGPDTLRAAVSACRLPILAIGGITVENVHEIARTEAAGVAAISLFLGRQAAGAIAAPSLRRVAAEIRRAFADARSLGR